MWGASGMSDQTCEELCLIDSGVTDLNTLHFRHQLQVLNLHCNQIQQIQNLQSLINLKHLDLSSNQIQNIRGLDSLEQLRTLNLSCNQIEIVQGLENLRSLVKLNVSFNHIASISGLQAIEGPSYKLSHVELHGNRLLSVEHVSRCLEGAVNLRRLVLSQGSADNPCCTQTDYRKILLSSLPRLHVLNGIDRHGNPADDLDILLDIPGLDQYMELLDSNPSSEVNVHDLITPKIDAAMDAFKQRGISTPDISLSAPSDQESCSRSSSSHQRAAAHVGHLETKPGPAHEQRLEKLEHMMLNLLHSARDSNQHPLPTSGVDSSALDDSTSSPPPRRGKSTHHAAKRDIDETDESEDDRQKTTKHKSGSKGVHAKTSGSVKTAVRAKVKVRQEPTGPEQRRNRTDSKDKNTRGPDQLVIRGRSSSPPSNRTDGRRSGPDTRRVPVHNASDHTTDRSKVRGSTHPQSTRGHAVPLSAGGHDEELRDDVQATYVQIMQELETERERRWKAEQASKKLVDHIKELQTRAKKEEGVQDIALEATTRLKQALTSERDDKIHLEETIQTLGEQVDDLTSQVEEIRKSETDCHDALRTSEGTAKRAEIEHLRQQAHEAKKLQEATLKAAASSREVEILRNNVKTLKSQVHQLQELLANREQEHRKSLEGRYSPDSKEFQEVIQREIQRSEKAFSQQINHLNERLDKSKKDYADLEDEFRMALQIETLRFQELQKAYEKNSQDLAEYKQALLVAQRKDEKTSGMVTELTSLVKEQKGRITELTKAKQETTLDYKDRIQGLESHLDEARRRMVTLELLKQEKTKLQGEIQGQNSLIEGLRSEKKIWGEELAHQESGLAQDRGRMEAKIETLTTETATLKKQLEREADSVRIKAKMIDDQTETIRKLKEGLQERDGEVKKTREETVRLQRDLEDQLATEGMTNQELQERLDRTRERKDELKHQLGDLEDQLEDSKKAHSTLNRKWKEKSSLIGQLEQQVTAMKESWEGKEKKLMSERDKAVEAASMAVEKLRSIDDAFRKQLDSKEETLQRAVRELETEKQAEIDMANKRVVEVEEEMRLLLHENEANKRAMEERVKKLTRAFSELQHDLF